MFYLGARSRPPNPTTLRRNPKTQRSPPDPTRGLNASAHPNGPHAGPAAQAKVAISSSPPGPVYPFLTTRRWKTPWPVPEKSPHGVSRPMERNGAARSRGPLGSPSASPKKLGCRRLPAPGHRRPTGYPVLLRGELILDFPLPAPASGGQRSQPCIGAYDG